VNLEAHLDILRAFGMPVVVAVNRFPEDTDRELDELSRLAREAGATAVAVSDAFAQGGAGAVDLAQAVVEACRTPSQFQMLYPLEMPLAEKLRTIATTVYGAADVDLDRTALRRIEQFQKLGFGNLPVCIAKTQYSLSHDPNLLGRPRGFQFPIRDVRLASGAGYVYALAGDISTMPGLPAQPAAQRIDLDADGRITGLK
jgi:formate--tetrahydrofolate ligase